MSTSKVNEAPGRGIIQRMRECLRGFASNQDGATAIEFGFLAIPFAALTFAILESCVSFAAGEVLANATDDIARQIRTGQLRKAEIETNLREKICERLEIIVPSGCPDLVVELQNSNTFAEAAVKAKLMIQDNNIVTEGVHPGGALTINTLKVAYKWPVITDFMREKMSNLDGKTLLFSSVTWRNEPFDE